jgi:hypothetical protein
MCPVDAAIQSSYPHDGHGNHSCLPAPREFMEPDDGTLFLRISEVAQSDGNHPRC